MGVSKEVLAIYDTLTKCENEYAEATAKLINENTKFYLKPIDDAEIAKQLKVKRFLNIKLEKSGTVTAGKKILESNGGRTAILNFADAIRPGGWVLQGAPTQEENICRCSNLYPALLSEEAFKKYYYVNSVYMWPRNVSELYGADIDVPKGVTWEDLNPLHAVYTHRLMYFRDVTFFKDDTDYNLEEPYNLDVITCPSPAVLWSDKSTRDYVFRERAEQIVKSAILNGAENIVLGAWGCGAFGQNPEVVARTFMDVLRDYNCFANVIFAIRCTASNWKDDNYSVFERVCKGEQ